LHIAGSASPTLPQLDSLRWAHELVRRVVRSHLTSGGTVLTQVGDDPTHAEDTRLRILFDWTVIEVCRDAIDSGEAAPYQEAQPAVIGICTPSGRERVSEENERTLAALRDADALGITELPERFRFGALLRQVQAARGDVLLTIGGGVGVEHLARLYLGRRNPIVPLDLEIGSSDSDTPYGGPALASEARSHPEDFLQVTPPATAAAHLDGLRTRQDDLPPVETVAARVVDLLRDLCPQRAFYVRLLDPASESFADVEWFFRSVVDPVVQERGLQRVEVGTDPQRQGFLDAEIFTELHYASIAIVDMTEQRPNCAVELGYALARGHFVLLTARDGERLPFDVDKLPCLFWSREQEPDTLKQRLHNYWDKQIQRAPIVPQVPIS
jgi:hypothetical protein